jgi:hypothetical protein
MAKRYGHIGASPQREAMKLLDKATKQASPFTVPAAIQ